MKDVSKDVEGIVESWKEKVEGWEKEVEEGSRSEKGKSSMLVDVKKKMLLCKILKSGSEDELIDWCLNYCKEGLNKVSKVKGDIFNI